jgi:hypothetical protein
MGSMAGSGVSLPCRRQQMGRWLRSDWMWEERQPYSSTASTRERLTKNTSLSRSVMWRRQGRVLCCCAGSLCRARSAGVGAAGPHPPERETVPEPPDRQCVLGHSSFGIWQEVAFQLAIDVETLWELRENIDPESLRVMEIDEGVKRFHAHR